MQNKGPPQTSPGSKSMVFRWCARDKPQCTHKGTKKEYLFRWCARDKPQCTHKGINNKYIRGTLWANVLGIFSRAPGHRRPLDEGGNEERDRRLEVVKLLTALSYCVGGSFNVPCSNLVLGSLSLLSDECQRRNLESWLSVYGLVGCGLILGAYIIHQHFLVSYCVGGSSIISGFQQKS